MLSPGGQLNSDILQEYLNSGSDSSNSPYGCKLGRDWQDEAHFQENKMNYKPARFTQAAQRAFAASSAVLSTAHTQGNIVLKMYFN